MKLVDSNSYFENDAEQNPLAKVASVDNPYDLPFISDVRKRQCLLCLCPEGISEEALAVLSYHLTMLRSAKRLEAICVKPWGGEAKIRWRYDTQEIISAVLTIKPRKVQSATTELRKAGILLHGGLHYAKGQETRQSFYRLTDAAQDALALLTVPYAEYFNSNSPYNTPRVYRAWNEACAPREPGIQSMRVAMQHWRTLPLDALGAAIDTTFAEAMHRVDPSLAEAC